MMLLPRAVKVYVATTPCNLRKSFDGLSNEVREALGKDPLSGHVFVFLNSVLPASVRESRMRYSVPSRPNQEEGRWRGGCRHQPCG